VPETVYMDDKTCRLSETVTMSWSKLLQQMAESNSVNVIDMKSPMGHMYITSHSSS